MAYHYSSRLRRNFEDDDWLLVYEALDVVRANSGGVSVPNRYITDQVQLGKVHPMKSGRFNLYKYSEIKGLTYKRGPGRRRQENPSPVAERVRKFRAKRAPQKKAG